MVNGSIRLLLQFLISPNVEPLSGFDCNSTSFKEDHHIPWASDLQSFVPSRAAALIHVAKPIWIKFYGKFEISSNFLNLAISLSYLHTELRSERYWVERVPSADRAILSRLGTTSPPLWMQSYRVEFRTKFVRTLNPGARFNWKKILTKITKVKFEKESCTNQWSKEAGFFRLGRILSLGLSVNLSLGRIRKLPLKP